ncbi:OmpA family protein [Undibacterium sp. SXout11W]|uniref:OmpA family protein n=1 Tax=Undibacterium sp. SXout11W TaxID=3413050 RepID=UPI003BF444BA
MNKISMTPGALLMVAMLTACSTAPRSTSLLDNTRQQYQMAQNNPRIAQLAPIEMRQADDAMVLANNAASNNESREEIDKLAYLAGKKIDIAKEAAKQKNAENKIANAGKERDEMRLDQRTQEANQEKNRADQAVYAAQVAQANTQTAQQKVTALSVELADLKAKNTDRGIVITLGDLLFGTNDARLNPDGMRELQKLATVLQVHQQQTLLIEGHTDSTGGSAYNLQLSERRANAVSSALQLMGVQRARITMHGYGEQFPLLDNSTAENRQMNRRVEIILSDDTGHIVNR